MKAFGHDDGVAVANDPDKLRLVRIRVNELDAKCGGRHVVINVKLFQHGRVFVRWPTGPMSRFGSREAREDASGFDVLTKGNVDGASRRRPAGLELQRAILCNI